MTRIVSTDKNVTPPPRNSASWYGACDNNWQSALARSFDFRLTVYCPSRNTEESWTNVSCNQLPKDYSGSTPFNRSRREDQSENFGNDQPELEEHAPIEVASGITEALEERQQDKLGNIDEALARIEAGTFGECQDWTAHRQGAA